MSVDRLITYEDSVSFDAKKRGVKGREGIYGLVDPREPYAVRYVGSSGHMEHRLYAHWHGYGRTPKHRWVAGLRTEGVKVAMVVLELAEVGPRQSAARMTLENAWVELLGADLNVTLTPVGHAHSKDSTGKKLHAEIRELRSRVAQLERELAVLRGFDGATCNLDATLHRVARCEDPKSATQHNMGL